ncbi:MAG: SDR family oxidoreductase [Verrucomicrobiia bacterium]
MGAEYLITGGAGFIGSNLAEQLVRDGKSVRVFDNFSTGRRENLSGIKTKIEILDGDLRNIAEVRKAVVGVRYVLHVAALPSVQRSVEDPLTTHEVNVNGTLNLLIAARETRCQRVVLSSSSAVYGDTPTLPKREDMTPNPISPYGASKIIGEYYCHLFWQLYGLETVSLRYFNVFGPRQDPQSEYAAVIPKFITNMLAGRSPTIFGDGTQTRDFSHIDNVVEANLAACMASKKALGESFNIACGERISLLELVDTINRVTGKNITPKFDPARPGDILHSQADVTKARELLGWNPGINFREGIEKTIAWYRQPA